MREAKISCSEICVALVQFVIVSMSNRNSSSDASLNVSVFVNLVLLCMPTMLEKPNIAIGPVCPCICPSEKSAVEKFI